jgi:hypothetical protein
MNSKENPKVFGFSKDFVILLVGVTLIAFIAPSVLDKIGHWHERKWKYQDARQRVEKAGGWESLKSSSLLFFTNVQSKPYFDEFYFWRGKRHGTNPLPSSLETLQPWRIQYLRDSNNIPILSLRLYGIHRTGTYSEPYYAIWIVCTNVSTNYIPSMVGDGPGRRGIIERKGDLIFEVR